MKYFLKSSSGRELEVEILKQDQGATQLRVNDQLVEAEFLDVDRLGQYAVRLDGRSYAASVETETETQLRVTIAGESFRVNAVDERERVAGELASSRPKAESILASMPGIVVQICCEVGDQLEPGDPVLILEAMKMQNEVCSEHGGIVQEILAAPGENVAGNQLLVKLVPAEDSEGSS